MLVAQQIERMVAWVVLALLATGCFMVLGPFMSALLWAIILCFSTWPLYQQAERLLGGRRTLAAALMTLLWAATLVVPFVIVGVTLNDNVANLIAALQAGPPEPPAWIGKLPIVGIRLQNYWHSLAQDGVRWTAELQKLVALTGRWLLDTGLVFGGELVRLAFSVFIVFFLYRDGAAIAARLDVGVERIGGDRARRLLRLAGATVDGVVYGLVGTALAQGILAGFGFWVAGVPGPFFLGLLTFSLSVIPMGPPLIWVPASLWLFQQGATGWGIFLTAWGFFVVSSVDNLLKPYLISQGSNLPFILVLLGVLGGALAFGFIGIFLGPTLLAVGYNLLRGWTLSTTVHPASLPPLSPLEESGSRPSSTAKQD